MHWEVILPGIATLLAKLTGFSIDAVTLAGMPSRQTNLRKKAQITFRITSCNGIGEDEWRYAPNDEDPTAVDVTICGTRKFTLSVKCESYDAQETRMATWYLERIYTRLSRFSSIADLQALNVAWVDAGPTLDLSQVISDEDRVFSIGQKDFMFTTAVNDADDDESQPTPLIMHVELSSDTLDGTDGVPLPIQIGPDIIPPL